MTKKTKTFCYKIYVIFITLSNRLKKTDNMIDAKNHRNKIH